MRAPAHRAAFLPRLRGWYGFGGCFSSASSQRVKLDSRTTISRELILMIGSGLVLC
jgi:hypothetical protein